MLFVLLLCIFCTVVYTGISFNHLILKREIDGFFIVAMMYALVFGVFPTVISWQIVFNGSQSAYIKSILDISDEGTVALLYYYLIAFIGFWGIVLSYFGKIRKTTEIATRNVHKLKSGGFNNRLMSVVAWLCLLVGSISLFLWSKAYGSIFVLMKNANKVRSGFGIVNSLAFFKHPAKAVLIATLMFFTMVFKDAEKNRKNKTKKIIDCIGLLIASFLSYLYLIANDGRLTILIFLLAILWLVAAGKKIQNVTKMVFMGGCILILGVLLLNQMDNITYYIRFGVWNRSTNDGSLMQSIIHELGFLPQGGQTCIISAWNEKVQLTILDDMVTGLFAWFPTKFKPTGFEDVWNINTILMFGNLDVSHGQAPCSIVTQGYYDIRFLGVLLFCVALGKIARKIDDWDLAGNTLVYFAIKAEIMEMLFRSVPYFSLYDLILGFFPLVIMLAIYKIVGAIDYAIEKKKRG